MTYAELIHQNGWDVVIGRDNAIGLAKVIKEDFKTISGKDVLSKCYSVDNHDENSYRAPSKSRFGKGYQTLVVLVYTLPCGYATEVFPVS